MSRARLLRLFWIGAAAILVAAALIALFAILSGSFDRTDGRILGTLGTALLAGAAATAGATLVEAGLARRLGLAVAATAPAWFAIVTAAVWRDFPGSLGKTASTGFVVLGVELVVTTARALVGARRRLLPLFAATAAFVGAASALVVTAIWRDGLPPGTAKVMGAFWILGVLSYLLIPVGRRLTATPPGEEAPRRVDLAAGVEVGRSRVRLAGAEPAARECLYVVVSGRAQVGGLALEPGEAALVPAGTPSEVDAGSTVIAVEAR